MALDRETVRHVAARAGLELSDEGVDRAVLDLERVLIWAGQLPSAPPLPGPELAPRRRADEPAGVPAEPILEQAADRLRDLLRVPPVLEKDP